MDERRLNFFLALQEKVEESKSLSPEAKEKFYALVESSIGKPMIVKDLGGDYVDLAKMYKEAGFVPIDLGELVISVSDKKKKLEAESNIDLTKHRPIETSRFLQSLSSNANPLKFLIHEKTDGFILEEMQKQWKQELNKLWETNIRISLRNRFFYFAGGTDKKGENKGWYSWNEKKYHEFSYSANRVRDWCSKNPNAHPLLHFDSEIISFKKSIKFFNGNLEEQVKSVAASCFGELFGRFEIECQNLNKAEFYADADAFLSGLKHIFNSIKQRISNSNKIKITFEGKSTLKGRIRIIKIVHVGSESDKELNKNSLFGLDNGGDFKEAEKKFYQVCDWAIIARTPNQELNKLNILCDLKQIDRAKVNDEEIEGFTHVFTFYS